MDHRIGRMEEGWKIYRDENSSESGSSEHVSEMDVPDELSERRVIYHLIRFLKEMKFDT
jgi:hypothetical protein